jgi:serine/threonine-protein kinase
MALKIGTQLGAHEITALLGKGGMGEVYRARDLKLKREVAIKILPDEFSSDADRVGRFQREAEVLASLNHPNIAAIHSLEEFGGTRFLVLELVEGETLEERLRRGPIRVQEALAITNSICEALEAAHEKGVVHRDLKPGNVKITPDGKVKVLDFGLAKAISGASEGSAALSNSPTLVNSFGATNAGVIIGTAAYMSPEQARGYAADQRSDIFSLGCVLYEMLTGKQTFEGETVSDILASVLARDPDLASLPKDVNSRVTELLKRCLQKNRKKRWHCVADLRAELETIIASPPAAPAAEQLVLKTRPLWKRAIPVLATAVLVAAATTLVVWKPSSAPQVTRFSITVPREQALMSLIGTLGISPDGSQFAYAGDKRIYLRSMSEIDPKPLSGTDQSQTLALADPTFSPDGHSIVYTDASSTIQATLKKVGITGGAPVPIYEGRLPIGVQWDPSGIIFAEYQAGAPHRILRLSPNGGTPEVLAALKDDEAVSYAQLLPGGQAVLYNANKNPAEWDSGQIFVQPLKGERKTLFQGSSARYIPTGHIVYMVGGNLFAVPFDVRKLEVLGGPIPVIEGVMRGIGLGVAHLAYSGNGTLMYIPGPTSVGSNQTIGLFSTSGEGKEVGLPKGSYLFPRVSPDGKRIAFGTDNGKEVIIYVYDLSGTTSMQRLTFGGANRYPIWSADSQRVAYQSDRDGDRSIFWQRADGNGPVERLTTAEKGAQDIPDSFSADGHLSFTRSTPASSSVWILSVADKKAAPLDQSSGRFNGRSVFSPDGKWVAYQATEVGTDVFVQPFPATGAKYQISRTNTGHHPLWSPDGKELFYIPGPGGFLKVVVTTKGGFSFGNPMPALNGIALPEAGPSAMRNYDITPDGKSVLGILAPGVYPSQSAQASPPIRVVLNWFTELQQRVPR